MKRMIKCVTAAIIVSLTNMVAYGDSFNLRSNCGEFEAHEDTDNGLMLSLTPLWEMEIANADGYEGQFSMAHDGKYLYLCVGLYNDYSKFILRKIDASSGEYIETIEVATPSDFRTSNTQAHYTIAIDDYGEMLVALNQSFDRKIRNQSIITTYRFDLTSKSFDASSRLEFPVETATAWNNQDNPRLERIERLTGSLTEGNFSFEAAIEWGNNRNFTAGYYKFTAAQWAPSVERISLIPAPQPNQTINPTADIARFPGDSDCFMVTSRENQGSKFVLPMLYNATQGSYTDNLNHWWNGNSNSSVRMGFSFIEHAGKTYGVSALVHDDSDGGAGSQFRIAEFPSTEDLQNVVPLWDFPNTPFPAGQTEHKMDKTAYRQIIIPAKQISQHRNAPGTLPEDSNFYVWSPGVGAAAYKLANTSSDQTGVVSSVICDSINIEIQQQGQILNIISSCCIESLTVYGIDGIPTELLPIMPNSFSAANLMPGIYIAVIEETPIKFVLK